MKSTKSISYNEGFSPQKTGKFAGYLFLFNLLIPTLGYVFVQSKLFVAGNPIQTSTNIIANENMFRIGLLSEFILSVGLILLGISLYQLLRNINTLFARIALLLKTTEAALVAVVSLLSFLALQILIGNSPSGIDSESLAGILFNQHGTLNSVPMVFLGIEMVIFNYLFCKSQMIPKWMARFGMISFVLIFIFSICSTVAPQLASMLLTLPSFIYELVIGIWLIIKGGRMNIQ
jgi:hypothetical protein